MTQEELQEEILKVVGETKEMVNLLRYDIFHRKYGNIKNKNEVVDRLNEIIWNLNVPITNLSNKIKTL